MKKRVIRTALLVSNALILVIIIAFVTQSSQANAGVRSSAATLSVNNSAPLNPVDQLSSANIALTVARMSQLPETTAITNQADSEVTQLTLAPTNDNIVSKPQVVSTALKSKADIKTYTTVAGDTIASIAEKFGVTSNSIRWSNSLTGDSPNVGKKIAIPPVNGIVYTVKSGDTIDSLSQRFNANKDQLIAYNDAEISGIKVGEQIIIPNGEIVAPVLTGAGFGWGGSATFGFNGYDFGWCTWYVANRRAEIGRPVPANLGNAYTWGIRARAFGLPVGRAPQVGAVMVDVSIDHVAVVEKLNGDGSYWISEMNDHGHVAMDNASGSTGGWHVLDYRLVSAALASQYDYIY